MTEERKFAILFAATLLSARKLIDCIESDRPNFAKEYWVDIHITVYGPSRWQTARFRSSTRSVLTHPAVQ
jgi:hypothetical protein